MLDCERVVARSSGTGLSGYGSLGSREGNLGPGLPLAQGSHFDRKRHGEEWQDENNRPGEPFHH